MKNSEITMLIIVGTIISLCLVSFLIYLVVLVNKLKQENKEWIKWNKDLEISVRIKTETINKIKKDFETEAKNFKDLENRFLNLEKNHHELLEKHRNLVLKKDNEKENLIKELETEKELNTKHLESIDTLKLKNNINNEEFYLCLLKTYRNFTKIDSSIDGRTKAFKEFILTKEAIEYLILLLLDTENTTYVPSDKLIKILTKERIKNTEIGNYDLFIENNKIIFKNRLK